MYGKDYLDQRDADRARAKIRAAIDAALLDVEDGYTRERVRADFTPGGNVQSMMQNQMMAHMQRPAQLGAPYYGIGLLNSLIGWRDR
jgi:hypothetical protein